MEKLLFQPRKGVEFTKRTEVPLLKVEYAVYQTALARMIEDWLGGKIGDGAPSDSTEIEDITEVNDKVNGKSNGDFLGQDAQLVYNEMVKIKVPGHLKVASSHRKWLRLTYNFLKIIGAVFSEEIQDLIRIHDLSKYTHREVLGYAVMFGDGSVDWRQLKEEAEKIEWDNTLHNHYAGNPHHPEYFYPLMEDGKRDKSIPMLKFDPKNGKHYLVESVIDMLAARGERTLGNDTNFDICKWFDIDEKYFFRYAEADKMFVKNLLSEYKILAKKFFSRDVNAKSIQGYFDERPVVLRKIAVSEQVI